MPAWNQPAAALQPKVTPTLQTADVIASCVKLLALALVAGAASYFRVVVFVLAPAPARVRLIADLLLVSVSAISGMRASYTAYVWKSRRSCQAEQEKMAASQRQLLGLPPTIPRPLTPASILRKPLPGFGGGPGSTQATPMSPPLRYGAGGTGPGGLGLATEQQAPSGYLPAPAAAAAVTPLTAGSAGVSRPSPGFGSAVATPQQLQHYLDGLEVASSAGRGAAQPLGGGTGTAGLLGGFTPGSLAGYAGTPASGYAGTPTPVRGAGLSMGSPFFAIFDTATPTTGGAGAGGSSVAGGASESASASLLTTPVGAGQGAYAAAEAPDVAASPALPFGVELPKYRPSWLPRAKAASIVSSGAQEVTEATSEQEKHQFLWDVCKVRREWLEVWTERLREWFASRVLQPLVVTVQSAHAGPNALLAKYGQAAAKLPPLPSVFEAPGTVGAGGAGGAGAGAGSSRTPGGGMGPGAGGTGSALSVSQQQQQAAADVEVVLRHTQQLAGMMCQQAATNPTLAADAKALVEGLVRYEQLLLLLRGRRPAELLPPAPPGYLWARAQQLAQGTCCPAYNWNGGGSWAGRLWSPDLPTDSMLLLYLFAAFIDAPGWEFSASGSNAGASASTTTGTPIGGRGVGGAGAMPLPLYLGTVRSTRPPPQYSAILAYRPERPGRGVDAVLALSQGGAKASGTPGGAGGLLLLPGTSTLFCFLAEGRLLALAGHNALFHSLIAFLTYHKAKYNSALGAHYLQDAALQLDEVVEPPQPGAGVVTPHWVFGWWFPPRTSRPKAD